MATKINTIDDYINTFPESTQEILKNIRETIQKAVPKAEEAINYDMPTFKLKGKNLVHFSVWKNHIGMYPQPEGSKTFQQELTPYKAGTSTVQFPLDRPIPYDLVKQMVSFLAREMAEEEHYRRAREKPPEKTPARAKETPGRKANAKPKTVAKQKTVVKRKAVIKRKPAAKPKAAVKPKAAARIKAVSRQSKAGKKILKTGGKSWRQENKKSRRTYGSTGRRKKQRSSTPASLKTQKSVKKSAPPKRAMKSTASRKGR